MAELAIVIDAKDSVAVALEELPVGLNCPVLVGDEQRNVQIAEKIPFGHKFALRRITRGENILKYGEVIGEAIADIEPGTWVHVHNLVSRRAKERVREVEA